MRALKTGCPPPPSITLQHSNNDLIVRLSHITLCSTYFGEQCTYNEPQQTDKTRIILYKLQRKEINDWQQKHKYSHTYAYNENYEEKRKK